MTLDELINTLQLLKLDGGVPGTERVLIDVGCYLTELESCDLDASDQGIIIWCGDRVVEG